MARNKNPNACSNCGGPCDRPSVDNHGAAYLGCRVCVVVAEPLATREICGCDESKGLRSELSMARARLTAIAKLVATRPPDTIGGDSYASECCHQVAEVLAPEWLP